MLNNCYFFDSGDGVQGKMSRTRESCQLVGVLSFPLSEMT